MTYRQDRTGRTATMTGMKMYRLDAGRIVEFWGETDLHSLLRGLGLVPTSCPPSPDRQLTDRLVGRLVGRANRHCRPRVGVSCRA